MPGWPLVLTALRVMYVTVPLPLVTFTGSGTSVTCMAEAIVFRRFRALSGVLLTPAGQRAS